MITKRHSGNSNLETAAYKKFVDVISKANSKVLKDSIIKDFPASTIEVSRTKKVSRHDIITTHSVILKVGTSLEMEAITLTVTHKNDGITIELNALSDSTKYVNSVIVSPFLGLIWKN